jgi:hypothetical protein
LTTWRHDVTFNLHAWPVAFGLPAFLFPGHRRRDWITGTGSGKALQKKRLAYKKDTNRKKHKTGKVGTMLAQIDAKRKYEKIEACKYLILWRAWQDSNLRPTD